MKNAASFHAPLSLRISGKCFRSQELQNCLANKSAKVITIQQPFWLPTHLCKSLLALKGKKWSFLVTCKRFLLTPGENTKHSSLSGVQKDTKWKQDGASLAFKTNSPWQLAGWRAPDPLSSWQLKGFGAREKNGAVLQ